MLNLEVIFESKKKWFFFIWYNVLLDIALFPRSVVCTTGSRSLAWVRRLYWAYVESFIAPPCNWPRWYRSYCWTPVDSQPGVSERCWQWNCNNAQHLYWDLSVRVANRNCYLCQVSRWIRWAGAGGGGTPGTSFYFV